MTDPFMGLADEAPPNGAMLRKRLLTDAKRGFAKLHKIFVQRPAGGQRASMLAAMVTGRQERALDALLLLYALEPVLEGTPLPTNTWAKMLTTERGSCSTQGAARAFDTLVRLKLATRRPAGRFMDVMPLFEDGSGASWDRPGRDLTKVGKGYLTIPHDYWITGLADRLALPGKAMFLIMLAETTKNQTFSMAVERAPDWYGVSERTAERGYRELRDQLNSRDEPLLREHRQVVVDPRSPTGLRAVWHRALSDPYSQAARARLQIRSVRAVQEAAEAAEKHRTASKIAAERPSETPKDPWGEPAPGHEATEVRTTNGPTKERQPTGRRTDHD